MRTILTSNSLRCPSVTPRGLSKAGNSQRTRLSAHQKNLIAYAPPPSGAHLPGFGGLNRVPRHRLIESLISPWERGPFRILAEGYLFSDEKSEPLVVTQELAPTTSIWYQMIPNRLTHQKSKAFAGSYITASSAGFGSSCSVQQGFIQYVRARS
jgi:hypothetical protein